MLDRCGFVVSVLLGTRLFLFDSTRFTVSPTPVKQTLIRSFDAFELPDYGVGLHRGKLKRAGSLGHKKSYR